MLIKSSPSKFTGGIPVIWKGMDLNFLKKFIFNYPNLQLNSNQENLLYESARSAILHSLECLNIGINDQVIVSSFTCDAVTKAVINSGAKIIYVDINQDLTMNDKCVLGAINKNTKAIILQNTFGRLGLKVDTIKKIKKNNIFILEDNCLSVGSKYMGNYLGKYGDVSIFSLEASKTVTLGWGGVLKINNLKFKKKILKNYDLLKKIHVFNDIRRLFQLFISLYFIKYPKPFGNLVWYFLYGTKVFRKSDTGIKLYKKKIGFLTKQFFLYLYPNFKNLFKKSNKNYISLIHQINKANLKCPLIQKKNEIIVTPRIPIIVKNKNKILKMSKKMRIEIGDWFTECPPKLNSRRIKIHSYKMSRVISKKIINIPCYFSLEKKEILKLKKFIFNIGLIEKN